MRVVHGEEEGEFSLAWDELKGSLDALSLAAATDSSENLTFRIGGGRLIAGGLLPAGSRGRVRGETEEEASDALAIGGPADSSENLTLRVGVRG